VSRIKNISRVGWLVTGITAALVLVPTTAVAVTTAAETIITGGSGTGQASVTSAHQLLTTTVNPKAYVNTGFVTSEGQSSAPTAIVASPPAGDALIVTTIHLNTFSDPTPGNTDSVTFVIESGTGCDSHKVVGSYFELVDPGSVGETEIPYNPGLAVPGGDALCAAAGDNLDVTITATGYTVPSKEVPAGALHRAPALPLRPKS